MKVEAAMNGGFIWTLLMYNNFLSLTVHVTKLSLREGEGEGGGGRGRAMYAAHYTLAAITVVFIILFLLFPAPEEVVFLCEVKFYPPKTSELHEVTRYLLCMQIRRDINAGR